MKAAVEWESLPLCGSHCSQCSSPTTASGSVKGNGTETKCSYQDVLSHLKLSRSNELFSMSRPVKDHKLATRVSLELQLFAILDVREIDQTFVPYVWMVTSWNNQHIQWQPDHFCGIKSVSLPTDVLWKPDLTIEEMTEKDKAPPSTHLTIHSDGLVRIQNDQVLVSTCRMHIYKFPFDVQSCNLSFKSVVHSGEFDTIHPPPPPPFLSAVEEIELVHHQTPLEATGTMMRTQYEWLFVSMKVTNKTICTFQQQQDVLIFTITMKRRPQLYIVNFLLPVFFFLCLDLASFLISDSGGEKLSFKVTVLLAVTVMQLILNEILPSSSERIPLIVVYCFGIFTLMMLSLLESILVMYLMEKDSVVQDDGPTAVDRNLKDENNKRISRGECDILLQQLTGSSGRLAEESLGAEGVSEEKKAGYWTTTTKSINKIFFMFYLTASVMFLAGMTFIWTKQD
ncbi:5-hydroxytryptamine receptor 3A-like [Nelusetta ayraudi]|uniref:5-hydroxytryptamine receptor 3A-like n=1 Tax=Nelusetta ayraudi TaxID=303726 RepID=UPI003F72D75F